MFRGKGRLVLLLNRILARKGVPYHAIGCVNQLALMDLDLRPWGQKFAYYYGEWEKQLIDVTRQLYRGGIFIDIGSSLGLYVVCLGDLVRNAEAAIVSIEPVGFNLARQRTNVRLNGLDDIVQYFQLALGASEATLRLEADRDQEDNNAFICTTGDLEVQVTTLDRLVRTTGIDDVGFIKMDVEGYEPMVISGAEETIRRYHPVILAEFNRERMAINRFEMAPSWQFLTSEGYRAHQIVCGRLLPLLDPGEVENIFFLPSCQVAV